MSPLRREANMKNAELLPLNVNYFVIKRGFPLSRMIRS